MRVYDSFAEFDREERRRRGLPTSEPAPEAPEDRAIVVRKRDVFQIPCVTIAALRAEGVIEVGRAEGTSVLFVRTRVKAHLFHVTSVPDRELDDYAVQLAVTWIDGYGLPGRAVAQNLGVNEATLQKALKSAGFERTIAWRYPGQKSRGKKGGRKNRRGGRLVRARDAVWQAQ